MKGVIRVLKYMGFFAGIVLFLIISCNAWVLLSTSKYIYDDISEVPVKPVCLVLGTSKSLDGRYMNPYFLDRMEAGQDLYTNKKVKHFIVSGDNSLVTYNEPRDMKNALVERGVPVERITMDFAGFRTFDSVVRCKEIFDQEDVVIVSQPFHTPRAVFIARRKGMNAVALNSKDDYTNIMSPLYWREVLARCKTVIDIFILRKTPKYLGEKIKIEFSDES
jgi:SanA protein